MIVHQADNISWSGRPDGLACRPQPRRVDVSVPDRRDAVGAGMAGRASMSASSGASHAPIRVVAQIKGVQRSPSRAQDLHRRGSCTSRPASAGRDLDVLNQLPEPRRKRPGSPASDTTAWIGRRLSPRVVTGPRINGFAAARCRDPASTFGGSVSGSGIPGVQPFDWHALRRTHEAPAWNPGRSASKQINDRLDRSAGSWAGSSQRRGTTSFPGPDPSGRLPRLGGNRPRGGPDRHWLVGYIPVTARGIGSA
jgi:hypothetical protein